LIQPNAGVAGCSSDLEEISAENCYIVKAIAQRPLLLKDKKILRRSIISLEEAL